jgi:hypothetical protein
MNRTENNNNSDKVNIDFNSIQYIDKASTRGHREKKAKPVRHVVTTSVCMIGIERRVAEKPDQDSRNKE